MGNYLKKSLILRNKSAGSEKLIQTSLGKWQRRKSQHVPVTYLRVMKEIRQLQTTQLLWLFLTPQVHLFQWNNLKKYKKKWTVVNLSLGFGRELFNFLFQFKNCIDPKVSMGFEYFTDVLAHYIFYARLNSVFLKLPESFWMSLPEDYCLSAHLGLRLSRALSFIKSIF